MKQCDFYIGILNEVPYCFVARGWAFKKLVVLPNEEIYSF